MKFPQQVFAFSCYRKSKCTFYTIIFCTWTLSWLATLALALCTINNNKVDSVFSRTLRCSCIFCSKRSDRTDGNLLENYLPHLLTTTTRPNGGWQFAAHTSVCVCTSMCVCACECGNKMFIVSLWLCNIYRTTGDHYKLNSQRNSQLAVCFGVSIISPNFVFICCKVSASAIYSHRIQLNQLTIVKSGQSWLLQFKRL